MSQATPVQRLSAGPSYETSREEVQEIIQIFLDTIRKVPPCNAQGAEFKAVQDFVNLKRESISSAGYKVVITALQQLRPEKRNFSGTDLFRKCAIDALSNGNAQAIIDALTPVYAQDPASKDITTVIESILSSQDGRISATLSLLVSAFPKSPVTFSEEMIKLYPFTRHALLFLIKTRPELRPFLWNTAWKKGYPLQIVETILGLPESDPQRFPNTNDTNYIAYKGELLGIGVKQGLLCNRSISLSHPELFDAWNWVYEANTSQIEFAKRMQAIENSFLTLKKTALFLHPKFDPLFGPATLDVATWTSLQAPHTFRIRKLLNTRPDLLKPIWDLFCSNKDSLKGRNECLYVAEWILDQCNASAYNDLQLNLAYQGTLLGLAAKLNLLGDICPFDGAEKIHAAWKWAYENSKDSMTTNTRVQSMEDALQTLRDIGTFRSPKTQAECDALFADQGNVGDFPSNKDVEE